MFEYFIKLDEARPGIYTCNELHPVVLPELTPLGWANMGGTFRVCRGKFFTLTFGQF